MAREPVGRSTYMIEVLNVRGKVVETIETTRRNQEGAHRVARQHLVAKPRGTKMRMLRDGKVVETLTRTKDGWDFEVLNGNNVREAQRNYVDAHMPRQHKANGKKASTGKAR